MASLTNFVMQEILEYNLSFNLFSSFLAMKIMLHLFVFIIVASTVSLVSGVNAKGRRPHILYILADDLGFNNVGWQQQKHSMNIHKPEVETPAIDELVKTGVELERMYAYKYCSPSRSSFLSGRLPIHVTQNNVSTKCSLKIVKKWKMYIAVINSFNQYLTL